MLTKVSEQGDLVVWALASTGMLVSMSTLPSHGDLVGWTGTILSVATAFTGGFVMMYQRVQRARRDDRVEWMKLRQGSLQALLEQATKELTQAHQEIIQKTVKVDTVTKQNGEQLEQIIELTEHITRLGALIGRIPDRLGLAVHPATSEDPFATLGQTVRCLEDLVNQLRQTTQVLSNLAEFELNRPNVAKPEAEPDRGPEDVTTAPTNNTSHL